MPSNTEFPTIYFVSTTVSIYKALKNSFVNPAYRFFTQKVCLLKVASSYPETERPIFPQVFIFPLKYLNIIVQSINYTSIIKCNGLLSVFISYEFNSTLYKILFTSGRYFPNISPSLKMSFHFIENTIQT